MTKVRKSGGDISSSERKPVGAPPITDEAREKRCISEAIDMAEEQILNRTASSQVITHFLKLGTSLAELEKEKLRNENALLAAKTESLKAEAKNAEMFQKAMDAMKSYQGLRDLDADDEDYDDEEDEDE